MKHHHRISIERQFGSLAIEQRATDISLLMREVFPSYRWDLDCSPGQSDTRRLDIEVAGGETTILFANKEVQMYSSRKRDCNVDHRLQAALITILPSSMDTTIKTALDHYYRQAQRRLYPATASATCEA
jgi:hypothetical protein